MFYVVQLSTHLVFPLLAMVGELGRRQQHLIQLLGKKDKEIQDYSDQGYSVSRSEWVGKGCGRW